MNSFVLAQLHAVGSGAAHHAPAWAPWQRALMAASSSAYLANAVCWSRYDHPILAGVFIAVAILSTAADALSDAVFAPAALARVRTADRAVGSTALVASVVANSLSPVITACATLAALSAVSVLLWARAVARAEPKRWATYLCLQAGWHVYGAAVLCTVTWLAQPRDLQQSRQMPTALGRPRRLAGEPSSRHASSFPPHPSILPPPRTPPTSLDPAARRDALNVGRQLLKIETALDARLAAARPSSAGKRFPGDLLEPLGGPAPPSLAAAAADAAAPAPAAAAAAADALRRRPSGKPRVIRVLSLPSLPTAALGLSPLPPAPPPAAAAVSEAWAAAPPTAYPTAEEEAAAEAAEAAEWELYRCCFRVLRAWRREASSAALARTKAALLHRIWLGLLRLRVYRAWRSLVTLRAVATRRVVGDEHRQRRRGRAARAYEGARRVRDRRVALQRPLQAAAACAAARWEGGAAQE